jgi:sarcosine oxidase subunit delta
MSFLLSCPHCGPRDVHEFACTGEVTVRPKPREGSPSMRELTSYLYFRLNAAGLHREWWFHRACETWFLAERNTVSNEVARTWLPERPRGAD